MYWNVLHFIIQAGEQQVQPAEVVCDFEPALIQSARCQFPAVKIVGCLFYFKQVCLRRMKLLCIPRPEIKIAMKPKVLDMLMVLPPNKVAVQGVAYVKNQIRASCVRLNLPYSKRKWASFWAYFQRTWIRGFEVEQWNVHGVDRRLVSRTNSPLERFNKKINTAFSMARPSLARFVSTIEKMSRAKVQLIHDVAAKKAKAPPRQQCKLPKAVNLPDSVESSSSDSESESESAANLSDSDPGHDPYNSYEDDSDGSLSSSSSSGRNVCGESAQVQYESSSESSVASSDSNRERDGRAERERSGKESEDAEPDLSYDNEQVV